MKEAQLVPKIRRRIEMVVGKAKADECMKYMSRILEEHFDDIQDLRDQNAGLIQVLRGRSDAETHSIYPVLDEFHD